MQAERTGIMARYTEKVILDTFGQMLDEMPFDKITVSALARRSDISHNTFYYHYKDIYDLLMVWIRHVTAPFLSEEREYGTWREAIRAMLVQWQKYSRRIQHVFQSLSREQLEKNVFDQMGPLYLSLLRTLPEAADLTDSQLERISDYARYMVLGFLMRFLWNGMQDDIDAAVGDLDVLLRTFVSNAIKEARAGNLT